jgi:3-dehydroquinate synthase
MEDLPVHNNFEVKSHIGKYHVIFNSDLINNNTIENLGSHFIIDKNVFNLLPEELINNLEKKEVVIINAIEETKSYQGIEPIISSLLNQNLKRDSVLVAIGGGITQDITCFIATTFMRGI